MAVDPLEVGVWQDWSLEAMVETINHDWLSKDAEKSFYGTGAHCEGKRGQYHLYVNM